jgi:hypothetical protein
MRKFWMLLVALSLGFSGEAMAQAACKNFVGGVCLDKKEAPAKKPVKKSKPKKIIKKKRAAPKKTVAPEQQPVQPAKPIKVSANTCVKMSAGKASSMDFYKNVVYTNVVVRNTCNEAITVYMQLNACKSPKAYFNKMVGNSRMKFKLRKGGTVSHRVAHQEGLRGASSLARTNAAYGGAKTSFPKFGC